MEFKRIKGIREDNDLTQVKIANILNVKRSAYSLWELGINTIPLTKLAEFCNYFNVSMDYVLGLTNIKKYPLDRKNIDMNTLGSRLKEMRKKEKKTQEDIASLLNTTHSTWSAYENNKVLIPTIFIWKFAKEYNCSVDYLCGRIKDCG